MDHSNDDGGRLVLYDALKTSPGTTTSPGDINGDGVVGGQDLTIILSNWGVCVN